MKTYLVEMPKREADTLHEAAGLPLNEKISKHGWHTGGLRPLIVRQSDQSPYTYFAEFKRLRDAYDFAIWASGWVAAHRRDGKCPLFSVVR